LARSNFSQFRSLDLRLSSKLVPLPPGSIQESISTCTFLKSHWPQHFHLTPPLALAPHNNQIPLPLLTLLSSPCPWFNPHTNPTLIIAQTHYLVWVPSAFFKSQDPSTYHTVQDLEESVFILKTQKKKKIEITFEPFFNQVGY
jgi:hypothetical protein